MDMVEAPIEVKAMIPDVMFMKLKHNTSKPIADTTNSEVDVVKLLQVYGMVNSEGSELRRRKVRLH